MKYYSRIIKRSNKVMHVITWKISKAFAKLKKMVTKDSIQYDSIYMNSRKEKKYNDRKGSMAASAQGQGMGWTKMGIREIFYILIMVLDILLCTLVKIYQIIHLKLITLIECKLHLDKAD